MEPDEPDEPQPQPDPDVEPQIVYGTAVLQADTNTEPPEPPAEGAE